MKKYRFITPVISVILVLVLFTSALISLYSAPNRFSVTFANRDDLFDGITVELEVFDSDDGYSLISSVTAGSTAHPKFRYGDKYSDHYNYDYHYDRYYRGESFVMPGYSFMVPEDEQKIAAEGGESYSSTVTYPDGTTQTQTYRDPYYEVGRVYISRSLYAGEPLYAKRIYESEPILLEANENLEIFVGGGTNSVPYEPTYIVLKTKDGSTRIHRTSEGITYWSDAEGNVFFLDCIEDVYFKESTIHSFTKTGEGESDYEYERIADITLDSDRKILDYRAYGNASIIVTEDESKVKYVSTCDHATGKLYNVCSLNEDVAEKVVIGYSNGVACVRFSSEEYISYTEGTKTYTVKNIYYRAIDLSSHKLIASGDIEKLITNNVYSSLYYQKADDVMDILWQNGRLYIIDNAAIQTSSPETIGNIPVISVIDADGEVLMGYHFLDVKYPENGGQNIITRFKR